MRILVLTAHLPYPPNTGGAIRTHALLCGLARRHDVHLVSGARAPVPPPFIDALRRYCRSLAIVTPPDHPRAVPRVVSQTVERAAIDLVFCSYLDTAAHCRHLRHVPVAVDLYDIVSRLVARRQSEPDRPWAWIRRRLWFMRARRLERAAARMAALVTVTSEHDRRLARSFAGTTRFAVVPNGVDLEHYAPSPHATGDPDELLFVGGLHWPPNVEAVHFFCREVLPRIRTRNPAARLTIVGGSPPESIQALVGKRVSVTGYVDDVRPFYERCGVVVVPLLAGSGTRLKILEAMAMGRPVVSTTIGAEGLQVRDGHDLLIADEPDAFAGSVLRLQRDREAAARLAGQARRTIAAAGYDWQAIAERLEHLLTTTVDQYHRRQQGRREPCMTGGEVGDSR